MNERDHNLDRQTAFFGPKESIVEKMLMDIKESDSIEYNSVSKKKLNESVLLKNFFHHRILKWLPNCIKKELFRSVFDTKNNLFKKREEPFLIVFINTFELFGEEEFWILISLLKQCNPNGKFAFYYYAVIDCCYPHLFPKVKEQFDLILSFDRYSSNKYKTVYYGPINEKGFVKFDDKFEESDVFFSGKKGDPERINLITDCFQFITDNQKKCIFFIDGCNSADKKRIIERLWTVCADASMLTNYETSIRYRNSVISFLYLPYAKNIGYIKNTKAVLEIGSPSDQGNIYTARVAQAFSYEKKLITNSKMLMNEPFYRENNCILFEKAADIDTHSIATPFEKMDYDFSGLSMVEYIKNTLFQK